VVAAVEEWAIVIQGGGPVPQGNTTPAGGPVKIADSVTVVVELELEGKEVVVGLVTALGDALAVVLVVVVLFLILDAGIMVVEADDSLLF